MPSLQFGRIEIGRDGPLPTDESYSASTPAVAIVADLIGHRKRVLDVGCGTGVLSRALAAHECDIVGIDRDPLAIEEARRYCAHAFVADIETTPIGDIVGGQTFETILLADVLDNLHEPMRLLDDCRALLDESGSVVATIANATHGTTRLALRSNTFADTIDRARLRFFGAKGIEDLFAQAGYRIERMERVFAPFDHTGVSAAEIPEIDADPECETLAFVVRAIPLSNEAKYQTIIQRDRELAQLQEERAPANDEHDRNEQLANDLSAHVSRSDAREAALAADVAALRDQVAEQSAEITRVGNALDVSNSRLIRHADVLADETRSELQRIATLIDAVQSSPAWALKRAFSRVLGAFRR